MRRGSAGGPVEHLANESGAHHSGANAARAIAQFAVVAHHHETIGATGIGVSERRDDLVVGRGGAAVTEDDDLHRWRDDAPKRRAQRVESGVIASANDVVPVDEELLRVREQPPLVVYHRLMLLCVDLDGVVYRGSEPVPGVGPLLTARRAAGDRIVYVTNNSFLRLDEYRARIESCGAPFSEEGIVTAAAAVAERFLAEGRSRILVYGADGLVSWLRARGLDARRATTIPDEATLAAWAPDGVTVGLDRESGARELALAAAAVRAGALLVAPNRDATYPEPTGLIPGTGAAVAALEAATGVVAEIVGKPAPDLIHVAMRRVGATAATTVVIGDSTATDIAAANAAGVRSILLLTGVTGADDVATLPTRERPTFVARDAHALGRLLGDIALGLERT